MTRLRKLQSVLRKTQRLLSAQHNVTTQTTAIAATRCQSSISLTSETLPQFGYDVKPFEAVPTLTRFEILRGILPGGKFYGKDTIEFLLALHKEKGDIVLMPGMFGKKETLLTQNPSDFEVIFRNEGALPERNIFEILHYHRNVYRKDYFGESSGLVTSEGKPWSDFRKLVNPILMHSKNVKVYLPILSKVNEDFIARIKEIRDPLTLEVPADFKTDINNWTLESVSVVALDRQLGVIAGNNPDGKRIGDNLLEFFQLSSQLEVKPSLWRYLPNRKLQRAMDVMDDLVAISEKYVNMAIERIELSPTEKPDAEKSVLEKLLKINKKVAIIMSMDMMLAGVDMTTTTFTGLLLCLAKYPAKQQKLREEILKILPNKDSPLTEQSLKQLPYLRACLKESLRYYPIMTGNVRTAVQDLVLSGYQVPKGTKLVMVNCNILRNEQHFSSPNEFIPERWLRQSNSSVKGEETTQCSHASRSANPFVCLPFGFGPRSCLGRRIAEMEVEIGAVNIIRNFKLEFNYSTEKPFRASLINMPNIPLKFKFIDIVD